MIFIITLSFYCYFNRGLTNEIQANELNKITTYQLLLNNEKVLKKLYFQADIYNNKRIERYFT